MTTRRFLVRGNTSDGAPVTYEVETAEEAIHVAAVQNASGMQDIIIQQATYENLSPADMQDLGALPPGAPS
jgi:hypothetical protein